MTIPGPGSAAFIAAAVCGYAATAGNLPDSPLAWIIRLGLVGAVFALAGVGWRIEQLHKPQPDVIASQISK